MNVTLLMILMFVGGVLFFLFLYSLDMPKKSWQKYADQKNFFYQCKYDGLLGNSPRIKGKVDGFVFELKIESRGGAPSGTLHPVHFYFAF